MHSQSRLGKRPKNFARRECNIDAVHSNQRQPLTPLELLLFEKVISRRQISPLEGRCRNSQERQAMKNDQSKDPLQGVTLETIVTSLVDHFGWDVLAQKININCFKSDPSIKSSLKYLRKTQWARDKVESLYISIV